MAQYSVSARHPKEPVRDPGTHATVARASLETLRVQTLLVAGWLLWQSSGAALPPLSIYPAPALPLPPVWSAELPLIKVELVLKRA